MGCFSWRPVVAFLLVFIGLAFQARAQELASDGVRYRVDLNGTWKTMPVESGFQFHYPPALPPSGNWKDVTVPWREPTSIPTIGGPYTSAIADYLNKEKTAFKRTSGMAAWFTRGFTMPGGKIPSGYRAVLHFHGMAFKSETWLNDRKLGTWLLGQVPVEYDVTDVLKTSGENRLVVGLTEREALIDIAAKTYIAPVAGAMAGIWGDVELRLIPDTSIQDVFVKTSVKNKNIELEVTIANAGSVARLLTPRVLLTDMDGVPQTQIVGQPIAVAPGQSQTVKLKKDWIAANLWDVQKPWLYWAVVELTDAAGTLVSDRYRQRFGFREFEIRGRDFFLNGRRITWLRNSTLMSLPADKNVARQNIANDLGNPYNCLRLHLGFAPDVVFDAADELGMMLVPESAWWHVNEAKFNINSKHLWLDNVTAYWKAFMKMHRNHPSVVAWSMANETMWGKTDPPLMEAAQKLVEAARAMDPTRPLDGDAEVTWGGRLDIINIHYPEGAIMNAYRGKYSNAGLVLPNDFYWLSTDRTTENISWRANFKWDRPLVLGEFFLNEGADQSYSSFMGESVYDWQRWESESFTGERKSTDNEWALALQRWCDVYRLQGVAGLNPWSSDRSLAMPMLAVRPLNFHPNYASGSTGTRKVVVYNETGGRDSGPVYHRMSLLCRLMDESDRLLWEKLIPAQVDQGQVKSVDIPIEFPVVAQQTRTRLLVRLQYMRGSSWRELDRHEETIFVMPRPRLHDVAADQIVLLDAATNQTATLLKDLGLSCKSVSGIGEKELAGVKLLIVGETANAMPYKKAIASFVKDGGSAIILRQERATPIVPELPDVDDQHVTSRSWRRIHDHPITAGLDEKQLSYWLPDHLVAFKTLRKSNLGSVRHLLDCGGRLGMGWSPMAETLYGQGTFIQMQFNLAGVKGPVDPAALQLLANAIRYAVTYQPRVTQPLRLLEDTDKDVQAALLAASVVTSDGLGSGNGPVLVDGRSSITAAQLEKLQDHLTRGGYLWLHITKAEELAKVARLLPVKIEAAATESKAIGGIRRSDDPLISNISSHDLAWTGRKDSAMPSPLGGTRWKTASLESATSLIEPGMLMKIPAGKGTILLDSLVWESALGINADRVTRVVGSLAANMGASIRSISGDQATYGYFPVDISGVANMAYYDPTPNDGQGGWTDAGESDMRYFLTDHVGAINGMDIASAEFPPTVEFLGRPFTLLNPKKTGNRAIVSLRGQDHGRMMPESARNIPVGRSADKLWFLHAAAWGPSRPNQEVARYVVKYSDGTQEVFSIRFNIEIGDWWNPSPLPQAKVAWSGRNAVHSPVGMYLTEWTNPQPKKTISTIDLIANLSPTQIVVVAITGGTVQEGTASSGDAAIGGAAKMRTIAHWDMGDFRGTGVPNRISGAGALKVDPKTMPAMAEADGSKVLRFKNGQQISGDARQVPGLGVGGPFSLTMTITAEDKPSGYCGGLFEMMSYLKAGFRLVLSQGTMKPVMEIYYDNAPAKYLTSQTPLSLNRTYEITVAFDGRYARMYLDGRMDAMLECPPPTAWAREFRMGMAGGKDYFFNGTIHSVVVRVPE